MSFDNAFELHIDALNGFPMHLGTYGSCQLAIDVEGNRGTGNGHVERFEVGRLVVIFVSEVGPEREVGPFEENSLG